MINLAGKESGPTASQFGTPGITAVMPSMAGSSPRDGANGRCVNMALIVGTNKDDFVVRREMKHPAQR